MKKRICFITAIPGTAESFLRDHIAALGKDYDVYLLANIKSEDEVKMLALKGWCQLEICRGISLFRDIKAVFKAKRYFKEMRFDAVHSVTPKAGLVTALAGWLAGIKHRTHIFTGQVWATKKGLMRLLLKTFDKVIARLDNHILVDGMSQKFFLEQEGVLREGQAVVFANGSICGVNSSRFVPDVQARKEVRNGIGIKDDALCFIFLGRLNRDKGISELYEAFNRLAAEENNVFLLFVGRDEENYIGKLPKYTNIQEGENFYYYGVTHEAERILNAGDVFVLPTYREGFGTSVLEAACIGLPCIASDAYGVLDAYVEGETGMRCKVGDSESLYRCMKTLYDHPEMVKDMGIKSRDRAMKSFRGADLTECWVRYYRSLLSN